MNTIVGHRLKIRLRIKIVITFAGTQLFTAIARMQFQNVFFGVRDVSITI